MENSPGYPQRVSNQKLKEQMTSDTAWATFQGTALRRSIRSRKATSCLILRIRHSPGDNTLVVKGKSTPAGVKGERARDRQGPAGRSGAGNGAAPNPDCGAGYATLYDLSQFTELYARNACMWI